MAFFSSKGRKINRNLFSHEVATGLNSQVEKLEAEVKELKAQNQRLKNRLIARQTELGLLI
jgi:chaperonin cofactor prefoldin